MPTNDQDLRALTHLARRLRDETHGCRTWDEAGTYAVLKAELAGKNLLIACQRVLGHATDPDAKTPGAIKRPFTPEPTHEPARVTFDPRQVCHRCNLNEPTCRANADHPYLSVEAARAIASSGVPDTVRSAIAKPGEQLCRHGVRPQDCADHDPRRNQPKPAPVEESA